MPGNRRVFISHAHEDDALCEPLLAALDAWGVDYWFDRERITAGNDLAESIEKAIAEHDIFVRICTANTQKSYWVGLETKAFRGLQAEDHRVSHDGQRVLINLILDAGYQRTPLDFPFVFVDATAGSRRAWLAELRRAVVADASDPKDFGPPPEDPLLLVGYLYVEDNGKEKILIRGDGRLPLIRTFPDQRPTASNVNALIAESVTRFFEEADITMDDALAAGISAPLIRPLHEIDRRALTVDTRPWFLFKIRLNKEIGDSAAWSKRGYAWTSKDGPARSWTNIEYAYGEDQFERSLPRLDPDPYKLICADRVSLEWGLRVLECVDMLIFRMNFVGAVEFLIAQRRDDGSWEYPKGGLENHETPLEGALREIEEEVTIAEHDLTLCGDLGWQMVDVKYRPGKFYDTLRVNGLTFRYSGDRARLDLSKVNELKAYRWLPYDQALAKIKLPYAAEFFHRWKQRSRSILARARSASQVD